MASMRPSIWKLDELVHTPVLAGTGRTLNIPWQAMGGKKMKHREQIRVPVAPAEAPEGGWGYVVMLGVVFGIVSGIFA